VELDVDVDVSGSTLVLAERAFQARVKQLTNALGAALPSASAQ
jgi:hypothetical protein